MTTDAQRQAEAVSDQVEAIRLASNVDEGMSVGENLQSSNQEISGEVTDIRYRNQISIWNKETGLHSFALPYMASDLANQRIQTGPYAGESAWAFRKSDIPAEVRNRASQPKMMCYLHVEHPGSARYLGMGFASCTADGIPSQAALEALRALARQAVGVSPSPSPSPVAEPQVVEAAEESYYLTCSTCNQDFSGKSRAGASASLRAHEKREHATIE